MPVLPRTEQDEFTATVAWSMGRGVVFCVRQGHQLAAGQVMLPKSQSYPATGQGIRWEAGADAQR